MKRWVPGLLGLAAAAVAAPHLTRLGAQGRPMRPGAVPVAARDAKAPGGPTLDCELYDLASRIPKVGFYFAIEEMAGRSVCAQIDQREMDGWRTEFGGEGDPRPA